ncbi:MAG: hypothetical protein DHS20C13_04160 [Thermodesulfobacteriota bacterium]|nr:MAG: hypothetical protein DHS20C13_04160 [Thermodesulfobacteriota bacterium]
MKKNILNDLLETDLQYLYNTEKQIVKAMVKFHKVAADPDLRKAIQELLERSKVHILNLESVFEDLKFNKKGKKSKGMEGILEEAQEIVSKSGRTQPNVVDAALIGTIQRALHYKIATYRLLKTYAKLLDKQYVAELLDNSLDEDIRSDRKLLRIATRRVNPFLK